MMEDHGIAMAAEAATASEKADGAGRGCAEATSVPPCWPC